MALAPALNNLMVVRLWTVPENRVEDTLWEVMHEAGRLAEEIFRDRISQAIGTEVQVAPGNRFLF